MCVGFLQQKVPAYCFCYEPGCRGFTATDAPFNCNHNRLSKFSLSCPLGRGSRKFLDCRLKVADLAFKSVPCGCAFFFVRLDSTHGLSKLCPFPLHVCP